MEQGAEMHRLMSFTPTRLHNKRRLLLRGRRPVLSWLISDFDHFATIRLILNFIVSLHILFNRHVVPHAGQGHG